MEKDFIECPVCHEKVKNLIRHLRGNHDRSLKDREAIETAFPELIGCKLQITAFDTSKEYKCEFCDKVYRRKNDIQNHIRNQHPDHYCKTERKRKLPTIKCPICGKESGNMKQHIGDSHNMAWDDFCSEYNWDKQNVKIVTDEYRQSLSKNKKNYYNSDAGIERRKLQSKAWSENNPSKDRANISKAINSRAVHGAQSIESHSYYGIKVHYGGRSFRSFCEFEFYILCKLHNINVTYEPSNYCVKWFNKEKNFYTTYLPDFYIDDFGLIEIKCTNRDVRIAKENIKYKSVSSVYNSLAILYEITTPSMFFENRGITITIEDRLHFKKLILDAAADNKIKFTVPSNRSRVMKNIFDTDDLSKIDCITITHKSRYDNEFQED